MWPEPPALGHVASETPQVRLAVLKRHFLIIFPCVWTGCGKAQPLQPPPAHFFESTGREGIQELIE